MMNATAQARVESVRRIFLAHGPTSLGRLIRLYHERYDPTATADEIARAVRYLERRGDLVVAHAQVTTFGRRFVSWCLRDFATPKAEDVAAGAAVVVLLAACYWLGGVL